MTMQIHLLKQLDDAADLAFESVYALIGKRKMYVLFEKELGCDPKTDHETPKNILPLFYKSIELFKCGLKLRLQTTILQFQADITEYYNARFDKEVGVLMEQITEFCEKEHYRIIMDRTNKQIEKYQMANESYLRKELMNMARQMKMKQVITIYQPDGGNTEEKFHEYNVVFENQVQQRSQQYQEPFALDDGRNPIEILIGDNNATDDLEMMSRPVAVQTVNQTSAQNVQSQAQTDISLARMTVLEDMEMNLEKLRVQYETLQKERFNTEQHRAVQEKHLKEAIEKYKAETKDHEKTKKELASLREQFQTLEKTNQTLQDRLDFAASIHQGAKQSSGDRDSQYRAEIEALHTKVGQLQSQLEREFRQTYDKVVQCGMDDEVISLRETLNRIRAEYSDEVGRLQNEAKTLGKQLLQSKKQESFLQQKLTDIQASLLRDEGSSFAFQQMNELIEQQKDTIASLQASLERQRSQGSTHERHRQARKPPSARGPADALMSSLDADRTMLSALSGNTMDSYGDSRNGSQLEGGYSTAQQALESAEATSRTSKGSKGRKERRTPSAVDSASSVGSRGVSFDLTSITSLPGSERANVTFPSQNGLGQTLVQHPTIPRPPVTPQAIFNSLKQAEKKKSLRPAAPGNVTTPMARPNGENQHKGSNIPRAQPRVPSRLSGSGSRARIDEDRPEIDMTGITAEDFDELMSLHTTALEDDFQDSLQRETTLMDVHHKTSYLNTRDVGVQHGSDEITIIDFAPSYEAVVTQFAQAGIKIGHVEQSVAVLEEQIHDQQQAAKKPLREHQTFSQQVWQRAAAADEASARAGGSLVSVVRAMLETLVERRRERLDAYNEKLREIRARHKQRNQEIASGHGFKHPPLEGVAEIQKTNSLVSRMRDLDLQVIGKLEPPGSILVEQPPKQWPPTFGRAQSTTVGLLTVNVSRRSSMQPKRIQFVVK